MAQELSSLGGLRTGQVSENEHTPTDNYAIPPGTTPQATDSCDTLRPRTILGLHMLQSSLNKLNEASCGMKVHQILNVCPIRHL